MTRKIELSKVESMNGIVRVTVHAEGAEDPYTLTLTAEQAMRLAASLSWVAMPEAKSGDAAQLAEASRANFDALRFLHPSLSMKSKIDAFMIELFDSAKTVNPDDVAEIFDGVCRRLRITAAHLLQFANGAERAADAVREA